jgi:hypothetical protein
MALAILDRQEVDPTADRPAATTFNDVTVWRRDDGQGWRIVVDSANRK